MPTYWESLFDHNYLRWFHLNGSPSLCEIVQVHGLVEVTLPTGKTSRVPTVTLKQLQGEIEPAIGDDGKSLDTVKPLILNVTNGRSIREIHGEDSDQWVGGKIVLYQSLAKVFNKKLRKWEELKCIRIREPKDASEK